ncbi:MAG: DEAD/DEAH box helicase [Bacteroidetes bacterium RIFOXYA12_FULL_35_11]|nr:MAG: DEAD/DEAH box helicase [Bacteroidetes bacterium GWF2_35_48]OFY81540.1 MAG: DEAD/DEAH box helicase [Bacteroidetes bacterium RIFOXYA12_FULL_35_11]OFY94466.1 MAG: DEAD/DEAH box helicase [Bacteroidetes bacterium RIFOXYC12_FULL_35_7]HBX53079.1 DEAD/DEAH box helicase [Bacteroidales bacterium]
MTFENLEIIEPILKALKEEGYTHPTPVQEQSIPIILKRNDIIGCAQTGTGKTAAFAIPILQILKAESNTVRNARSIRNLILTPTRELAIQIGESFSAYGKYTGLKHTVIFGGVTQYSQTEALKAGVDILIATPGRLLDLISQKFIHLHNLKIFVLDEADRMLDMGFIHDVKKVIAQIPKKRQTLLFSATMPPEIVKLADTILIDPIMIAVTPVSSTVDVIDQAIYFVDKKDKNALLSHILKDKSVLSALVFTRTKHGADKVVRYLEKEHISAEAIHGNKSQNARQRALTNFKAKKTRVLVATDIAARGIDIDELSHVINYEIPNIPETYVHRIGRTGRAGLSGIALSFCDEEEKEFLRDIQRLISMKIPIMDEHPFPLIAGQHELVIEKRSSARNRNNNQGSLRRDKPYRKNYTTYK